MEGSRKRGQSSSWTVAPAEEEEEEEEEESHFSMVIFENYFINKLV
jgi:hypothetical protein